MTHGLRAHHQTGLKQTLRVDPAVLLSSTLLQLSAHELEQAIQTELAENPALERLDDESHPPSEEELLHHVAPAERLPSSTDREFTRSKPTDDGLDLNWVDMAAYEDTLEDHLRGQMSCLVPQEMSALGEYLIGSLDSRGYLTCSVEEAALACGASLEEAELALAALQSCEPAGIAARDLRECLILQLRQPEGVEEKLARAFVRNHWDLVLSRGVKALCRAYKAMPCIVDEALKVVSSLNPYPAEGFACHSHVRRSSSSQGVSPEIVLTRDETGWQVDLSGPSPLSLRVSPTYAKREKDLRKSPKAPADEKRHITEYSERARRFIRATQQRQKLMLALGHMLVEEQSGFVSTGRYQFLKPLTRSKVADLLGVHESTVSRATNGKFIQIADGTVVPFEVFFKPALRVQKMIEEILLEENPAYPLSDERIAKMLSERGVDVARRTVNKYRDRTRLLSSRRRRSA